MGCSSLYPNSAAIFSEGNVTALVRVSTRLGVSGDPGTRAASFASQTGIETACPGSRRPAWQMRRSRSKVIDWDRWKTFAPWSGTKPQRISASTTARSGESERTPVPPATRTGHPPENTFVSCLSHGLGIVESATAAGLRMETTRPLCLASPRRIRSASALLSSYGPTGSISDSSVTRPTR